MTQDDEGTRGPADDRWGRGVDKDRAVGGCEELGMGEEVAGCDWNKPGLMGCNQDRAMNVCLVSFGSCEGQADQCDDDDSDECLKILSQKQCFSVCRWSTKSELALFISTHRCGLPWF